MPVEAQTDNEWINFKKKHAKNYRNFKEETKKRALWENRISLIKAQNKKFKQGNATYNLTDYKFMDEVCIHHESYPKFLFK